MPYVAHIIHSSKCIESHSASDIYDAMHIFERYCGKLQCNCAGNFQMFYGSDEELQEMIIGEIGNCDDSNDQMIIDQLSDSLSPQLLQHYYDIKIADGSFNGYFVTFDNFRTNKGLCGECNISAGDTLHGKIYNCQDGCVSVKLDKKMVFVLCEA